MRFLLLQSYGAVDSGCAPMPEWSPGGSWGLASFQQALNEELTQRGELVDAQGWAGPESARYGVRAT